MTREEAIEVIRKEYACVDADCDIERSCGKCELHMPSKEPILRAYEMAIQTLSQEPTYEWQNGYDMGWEEAEVFYKEEPCDDAISRDFLFRVLDDFCGHDRTATITLDTLADLMYDMPPVTRSREKCIDDTPTVLKAMGEN